MGLYGAMTKDDVRPGTRYAGVAYTHEAVLVYSEIDQALHEAVDARHLRHGRAAPRARSTTGRRCSSSTASRTRTSRWRRSPAGTAGETTLLRILNAGLRTHAPVLDNGSLKIVAEDGNKLPFAKDQATVMLAAGKTHDALWTPAAAGVYSLYDRTLGLNAPGHRARRACWPS